MIPTNATIIRNAYEDSPRATFLRSSRHSRHRSPARCSSRSPLEPGRLRSRLAGDCIIMIKVDAPAVSAGHCTVTVRKDRARR